MYRGRKLKSNGRERRVSSVLQPIAGLKHLATDSRWFHRNVDGSGYALDECHHVQTSALLFPAGPGQHRAFPYQPPLEQQRKQHCRRTSPIPIVVGSVVGEAVNYRMGSGSSKESETSVKTEHRGTFDQPQQSATESRRDAKSKKAYHMRPTPTDGSDNDSTVNGSQRLSVVVARPTRPTSGGGSRSGRRQADNDAVDNINETHNNFVVTSPQTATQNDVQQHRPNPRSLHLPPSPIDLLSGHGVKVVRIKVAIDKRLTVVDERSLSVLKYKTPHFRALATVEVPPLVAGQRLQIGWIQVCRDMQFVNVYGDKGITSWEFPEIVSNKYRMVSDADGKQYPWYGSKTEVHNIEGPTLQANYVTIHMNDNFFPQVTWYIPHSDYNREPSLEFIYRKQRFYTFLALRDLTTNVYQILKTVAWMMELSIQVEPSNPLGERARVLGPIDQEKPRVFDDNTGIRLETYALNPPNANNSQVLVWRPRIGDPKIIVPPVQTTIDVNRYLITTKDQYTKLKQTLQKNKITF